MRKTDRPATSCGIRGAATTADRTAVGGSRVGPAAMSSTVHGVFTAALDRLVGQIKQDRAILAVVLCGSLSHDTVWSKSDIDLVLVTIDDQKIDAGDMALNADGVNVHAILTPRAEFRRIVE